MIYGIGCDIVKVSRFLRWLERPGMVERFFHEEELMEGTKNPGRLAEHYAVRFAAKESFSKALGTGIEGFDLKEVYVVKDGRGKPYLRLAGKAADLLESRCGKNACVHLSLSHEKEYAVAYVIIESEGSVMSRDYRE